MKQNLNLLIFSLLLLPVPACMSPDKKTNPFIGSWYHCDYVGQFNELHIFNDDLVLSLGGTSNYYDAHPYKIVNDTLRYYYELHNWIDTQGKPIFVKVQAVPSNDQLNLLWGSDDSVKYSWKFMQMPKALRPPEKNDSSFLDYWKLSQFNEREKYFSCQDQRKEEQRRIDSLRMDELIEGIL